MDVFISYSSKDQEWVRGELLERIEQAGLKAFIDFRDFTRGAPSIKECERGVVECRKTLLILTPNYVESGWAEIENIMAQSLDPANRELRLIPLLKAECDKPLRVGALTHIDFTDGANQDLAWRQLLTALGRPPEQDPPQEPERDQWFLAHPYPMPPNFTGRIAERQMLTDWLHGDIEHPLLSLRALGGFGKSALTWHWLTLDVTPDDWPRVVWWSFYETDAGFERFLVESLNYLSDGRLDATKLPAQEAVRTLLEALLAPGTLLVLDGFERELRAFGGLNAAYQGDDTRKSDLPNSESQIENETDCISPLAELFLRSVAAQPHLRGKVLLTTRLTPRAIEARGGGLLTGSRERELGELSPADAVAYFQAQGIRGTHTEIEAACRPYGNHPLSLCLLAGLIARDFEQPGDIAAARRLDVSGDLVQRQHHVLEVAYDSLETSARTLLGRVACFRSPVTYETLKALAETGEGEAPAEPHDGRAGGSAGASPSRQAITESTHGDLEPDLRDLITRGLVHHDRKANRFDLHPIVRRYAYDRLAEGDRTAAHRQLRDYFAAVPKPDQVTRVEDLAPVIELYHHTVRTGQLDKACDLIYDRLHDPLYFQLGAYQLIIDLLRPLFPDGEDRPPRLKEESDQAWTLTVLANSYSLSGQPRRAVPVYEQASALYEERENKDALATSLGSVASVAQLPIGELPAAEDNLRRRIALCREIKNEFNEAIGHRDLGQLLACRGADTDSAAELTTALEMFEKLNHLQGLGITWAYRALSALLRLRVLKHRGTKDTESPELCDLRASVFHSAQRALELADETASDARFVYPVRDYVQAHWLLGAAHRVAGRSDEAEQHLHEAQERCRRINLVVFEADILIDLARLHADRNETDETARLAEEARVIAERSGYVLQGADAHLELAKLARDRGDKVTATEHAREAHRLATCDGPPDYTYKAAYDEAGALLAELES